MGTCLNATVKFTPSISTRIACTACDDPFGAFAWAPSNASDAWAARHGWPDDAAWAESDWPAGVPFVQLYLLKPWGVRVRRARGWGWVQGFELPLPLQLCGGPQAGRAPACARTARCYTDGEAARYGHANTAPTPAHRSAPWWRASCSRLRRAVHRSPRAVRLSGT